MVLNSQESKSVYFDFAKDFPNQIATIELDQWINSNKNSEILKIEGYCDSVDTNEFNKKLASTRIQNVLNTLKLKGITISNKLELTIIGEDFKQSKIQAENRKVTIFYIKKSETKSYAVDLSSAEVGQYLTLKGLNFVGGQDVFLEQSLAVLEDLFRVMMENKSLRIEIQGHICCNPFDSADLSTKRAQAVFNFLIENKISLNRIFYKGFGSSMPMFPIPEKNENERIANRRVEILVLQK